MRIALHHGPREGIWRLVSWFVRYWTRGPYDHCEIVFSDGLSASSSLSDKGVRFVRKEYDPARWHFIDLKGFDEGYAREWFEEHQGERFDILAMLAFVWRPHAGRDNEWCCSEACASALRFVEAWRLCPNTIAAVLRSTRRTT